MWVVARTLSLSRLKSTYLHEYSSTQTSRWSEWLISRTGTSAICAWRRLSTQLDFASWLTRPFGWQHIYYPKVLSNQEMHQAQWLSSPSAPRSIMPFLIFWQILVPLSVLLSLESRPQIPQTQHTPSLSQMPAPVLPPRHFNCFSSMPTFMNLSWGFQVHSQDTIYAIQCASSYLL